MGKYLAGVDPHDWGPRGPAVGTLVYDAVMARTGEFRGREVVKKREVFYLRPVGGGVEWESDPALTYPAAEAERLLDLLVR